MIDRVISCWETFPKKRGFERRLHLMIFKSHMQCKMCAETFEVRKLEYEA